MSGRLYDGPTSVGGFPKNDTRRLSGSYPLSYQRPSTYPNPRTSPPDHETSLYSSQSGSPPYRHNYADNNNQRNYHDRYYTGSASPDQYKPSQGLANDTWDYQSKVSSQWHRPSAGPSRDSGPSANASRVFEPSESWKKSHARQERYSERPQFPERRHNDWSRRQPDHSSTRRADRYSPTRSTYSSNGWRNKSSSANKVQSGSHYSRRTTSSPSTSLDARYSSSRTSARSRSRSLSRTRSPRTTSSRQRSSVSRSERGRSRDSFHRKRSRSWSRSRSPSRSRSASRSSIASSRASDQEPVAPNVQPQASPPIQAKIEDPVEISLPKESTDQDEDTSSPINQEELPDAPMEPLALEIEPIALSTPPMTPSRNETVPSEVAPMKAESPPLLPAEADATMAAPESPLPLRPVPVIDFTMEDIPPRSGAKSISDVLRIVVMTRLLNDRQTLEERVNPVLQDNLERFGSQPRPCTTADELVEEVQRRHRQNVQIGIFPLVRKALVQRLEERHRQSEEKIQRLRQEYIERHRKWLKFCASLDQSFKPAVIEETPSVSSRITRRSAAAGLLGDAVRSDLEMEQIIATLGIDEATDPTYLSARNHATIPDMISATSGQVDYLYEDNNLLVHDTDDFFAPHTGIYDWTEEEKQIFLDKYAAFPKQFGIIADYLPHKTASQCVAFYYLHKKRAIDFRKVVAQYGPNRRRRRRTGKQKGNALLADIRQHDAEVRDSASRKGRSARKPIDPEPRKASGRRVSVQTPTTTPTPEPESRVKRRRMLSSSRATNVDVDMADENESDSERRSIKRAKRSRKAKATVAEANETEPSLKWSDQDKNLFTNIASVYGPDFGQIATLMPNKSLAEIERYYQSNASEFEQLHARVTCLLNPGKDPSVPRPPPQPVALESIMPPVPSSNTPFYPVWGLTSSSAPAISYTSSQTRGYTYAPYTSYYPHQHPQTFFGNDGTDRPTASYPTNH